MQINQPYRRRTPAVREHRRRDPAMLDQLVIERDRIAARIQDLTRAQAKLGRVIENVTAANVVQD